MIVSDDDETIQFVEEVTFDLLGGQTIMIPIPSSLDAEGIEYQIEEIDAGGAQGTAIHPNSFVANGHLGETISVEIVNSFASVQIDKQISSTVLFDGDEVSYDLVVTNTGAITLDPVVVDDVLPLAVSYVGFDIEGDAGTCVLSHSAKPQLVTCTLDAPLAPGATAPTITLLVVVDDVQPGEAVVNQARVRGAYDSDHDVAVSPAGTLSCEPTEDEVCDLSGTAAATGGTPATTTTIVNTTTTVEVQSQPPVTTVAAQLPKTGSNSTSTTLMLGLVMIGGGAALALASRRKPVS
jgi:LPXTG-motif cell wall-anchored protein/uncharacterized repeat protein (TIGR01451 family)